MTTHDPSGNRPDRRSAKRERSEDALPEAEAHKSPSSEVERFSTVSTDAAERKELENSLRRTQFIVDHSQDLIHWASPEGRILYVNDASCRRHGYSREELLRMTVGDIDPDAPRPYSDGFQAIRERGSFTFESRRRTKDGDFFPVEVTVNHVEYEGQEYNCAIARDISERKAAEKTLRLTEFSINRVTDMMSWIGPDGGFLFANDSICRNLGYTREEFLGLTVWEVDPNILDSWEARWLESLRHDSLTFESTHRRKNGEVFAVEVTTSHIEFEGQEYLVAFSRDIEERKRAEELLKAEVSRRRMLVQQSTDGIVILDESGGVYEANEAYAHMLGYSLEEIYQLHVWDWDTQFTKEQLLGMLEAVDEMGDHIQTRQRRKDGTLCEVEISTSGSVYGGEKFVFCVCRDITESKRAAEALRASEDRYQTLVNLSPDAIVVQADGKYVFANPAAAKIFGADSASEIVGRDMLEFIHPDYRGLISRRAPEVLAGVVAAPVEIKVLRLDGSPVPVEASAAKIEFDGRAATQVVFHDLTKRRETEKLLRLTQFSVDQAADSVFWTDSSGRLIYVSDSACRLHGYSREEMLAMTLFDIDPSLSAEQWSVLWERMKRQGSFTLETVSRMKGGGLVPVEVTANYLQFDGEEYNCVFLRDITDRIRAEEDRLKLERQLQHSQKLESLGVLAGGIAHDFNNILTSVLGNAELALSELSPSAPARENLLEITASSRRAASLCRQMLAYSGRGHFVTEDIDLRALVEDMLGLLNATISKKALLRLDLDVDLPPLRGDASQISQVIMNLVLNASEAIGEQSGVINISTGAKECSSEYLAQLYEAENLAPGLYLSLKVSDTGAGMDRDTQERIFEPFFTTKFTGRGLGLAAVLGIVRGHKGALRLESAVGKGTTFEILFPASESDAAIPTGEKGPAKSDWQGEGTILLADDEETIRTLGARMLASLGFKVITAADGREALERYAERRDEISLVILDLTMPHMDGEQAFRELRLLDPTVRVIVSSGYAESDIASRFADQDLVGFVHKPYTLAELSEQVQAALAS